jgi:hypothetical protein
MGKFFQLREANEDMLIVPGSFENDFYSPTVHSSQLHALSFFGVQVIFEGLEIRLRATKEQDETRQAESDEHV